MHLGSYHFTGDPADLLPAYERAMEQYPPDALELNVCVVEGDGITVYDACPTRADFDAFSTSDEFRGLLAAAGLPTPRVRSLGDVHATRVRTAVRA